MADRPLTAARLTRQAVERIDRGSTAEARALLAEALSLDPAYEPAWLWFAHIAATPSERRYCLEQAAAADHESSASQDLPQLRRVTAVAPPEVTDLGDPPPPPRGRSGWRGAAPRQPAGRGPVSRWGGLIGLVVLALALVVGLAVRGRYPSQPLYVAVVSGNSAVTPGALEEAVNSATLYFAQVNAEGGVNGHPIQVLAYDDANDPDRATAVAEQIVQDGRPLLVIGHRISSTSLAASPIYAQAGLPALTATATADAITAGNPGYFRVVFDNRTQGFLIAAYARYVLRAEHLSVIGGNADYGTSLANGLTSTFRTEGTIRHNLVIDVVGNHFDTTVAEAVAALTADDDPGPIVLALQADPALTVLTALHQAGVTAPIIGGDALAEPSFLAALAQALPSGLAGEPLFAASPLVMDSLTSESLRWFNAYRAAYGSDPTWRGATTYDAAIATVAALRAAGVTGDAAARADERLRTRAALASFNRPETAIPGLLGPIYFDATRTTPRAAAFGIARDGQYYSAFDQLRPYAPTTGLNVEDDLQSGAAVRVGEQVLERQRVVFTGVNLNQIRDLDTVDRSFFADFFVWFTYTGDDDAVAITFTNAVTPNVTLGEPVRTTVAGGVKYALYRVAERFKAPMTFADFPFDTQTLPISFQNQHLPSSKLVYAIAHEVRAQSQAERLHSGTNAAVPINDVPNWQATQVRFYQETVGSTALMGDPEATSATSGVEFALFTTALTIQRDLPAFLVKNLLPLALLAAITYVSLFFSHKQTGTRITFGVSGILTAVVLLASVTSALPQVGYTVAIEWGFYAFIFLAATCVLIGLAGDRLYDQRRLADVHRLDRFAHLYYPLFCLGVVLAYYLYFGRR